jgi:hypothetical protein
LILKENFFVLNHDDSFLLPDIGSKLKTLHVKVCTYCTRSESGAVFEDQKTVGQAEPGKEGLGKRMGKVRTRDGARQREIDKIER